MINVTIASGDLRHQERNPSFPLSPEALKLADAKAARIASRMTLQAYVRPDAVPEGSPENKELREETVALMQLMLEGVPQFDVAGLTESSAAFSIAGLVRHLKMKSLFVDDAPSPERIIMDLTDPGLGEHGSPMSSRFCFLEAMLRKNLLKVEPYDRNLKPIESIPKFQEVSALISIWYDVPIEDMCSATRLQGVVKARFRLAYLMRTVCLLSLTQIGQMLGNRDHTTVLNSINQTRIAMSKDVAVKKTIFAMCNIADQVGADRAYEFCRTGAHRL